MNTAALHVGDACAVLATLPARSVRCCVTSPPYYWLRDYGHGDQIGLELTPDAYVGRLVAVFREVRRVLADDGTLWLNLGDSYAGSRQGAGDVATDNRRNQGSRSVTVSRRRDRHPVPRSDRLLEGVKPKDLVGVPWLMAFALRADGWYLRSDVIWHKPNPMPESVTDRPTKAHEYVFLLSKSERYYYDAEAIAEPATSAEEIQWAGESPGMDGGHSHAGTGESTRRFKKGRSGNASRKFGDAVGRDDSHMGRSVPWEGITRNARSVWTIAGKPYAGAHFATFPEELARRCILAGSAPGDTVLDPFGGSGTTAAVAVGNGRSAVYIDLNPEYRHLAEQRIGPMFCRGAA